MNQTKSFRDHQNKRYSATANNQILLIAFFCISFFFSASVIYPIIHNDDHAHDVHPLAHSAVCNWVKQGKLCRSNTSIFLPVFIPVSVSFIVFTFFCFPKPDEPCHILKKTCLVPFRQQRAPPVMFSGIK
jgi:hypothetical protein